MVHSVSHFSFSLIKIRCLSLAQPTLTPAGHLTAVFRQKVRMTHFQLERPTSFSFAKTENQGLDCSQPPYLRTRKKTRVSEREVRRGGGRGLGSESEASKKNRDAVDIFGKKVKLLASSPCYRLVTNSFTP